MTSSSGGGLGDSKKTEQEKADELKKAEELKKDRMKAQQEGAAKVLSEIKQHKELIQKQLVHYLTAKKQGQRGKPEKEFDYKEFLETLKLTFFSKTTNKTETIAVLFCEAMFEAMASKSEFIPGIGYFNDNLDKDRLNHFFAHMPISQKDLFKLYLTSSNIKDPNFVSMIFIPAFNLLPNDQQLALSTSTINYAHKNMRDAFQEITRQSNLSTAQMNAIKERFNLFFSNTPPQPLSLQGAVLSLKTLSDLHPTKEQGRQITTAGTAGFFEDASQMLSSTLLQTSPTSTPSHESSDEKKEVPKLTKIVVRDAAHSEYTFDEKGELSGSISVICHTYVTPTEYYGQDAKLKEYAYAGGVSSDCANTIAGTLKKFKEHPVKGKIPYTFEEHLKKAMVQAFVVQSNNYLRDGSFEKIRNFRTSFSFARTYKHQDGLHVVGLSTGNTMLVAIDTATNQVIKTLAPVVKTTAKESSIERQGYSFADKDDVTARCLFFDVTLPPSAAIIGLTEGMYEHFAKVHTSESKDGDKTLISEDFDLDSKEVNTLLASCPTHASAETYQQAFQQAVFNKMQARHKELQPDLQEKHRLEAKIIELKNALLEKTFSNRIAHSSKNKEAVEALNNIFNSLENELKENEAALSKLNAKLKIPDFIGGDASFSFMRIPASEFTPSIKLLHSHLTKQIGGTYQESSEIKNTSGLFSGSHSRSVTANRLYAMKTLSHVDQYYLILRAEYEASDKKGTIGKALESTLNYANKSFSHLKDSKAELDPNGIEILKLIQSIEKSSLYKDFNTETLKAMAPHLKMLGDVAHQLILAQTPQEKVRVIKESGNALKSLDVAIHLAIYNNVSIDPKSAAILSNWSSFLETPLNKINKQLSDFAAKHDRTLTP